MHIDIYIYISCWYLIEVKLWVHMIPDILRYTRHIWIEIDLPLRPCLSQGDLEQEAQQQPNNDHHSRLLVGKKSWKTQHLEKERLVKKHRKVVMGTGTTLQVIHGFVQWNQSETHHIFYQSAKCWWIEDVYHSKWTSNAFKIWIPEILGRWLPVLAYPIWSHLGSAKASLAA